MKRISILISVTVITLLVLSLIMSCAEPAPAPAPAPAPTPAPAPAPKAITLRMTLAQPPMDQISLECIAGAERFNARAGGGYVMEVYPGEQICKYAESLDAVRTGAVEMMNTGWGGYAGSIPELAAPEHPFLYSSAKANAAAQEGILNVLTGVFESKANQKALACFYVGAMELITTKPVKTMDDWKGMLVQTDTSLGIALISQLGGSGEIIPFPEVYSAMEKGVVDASLLAPSFVLIAKINEIADYYTLFHALGTVHGFTVNLDIWNNMPPNVQNILVEEIKQTAKTLNDLYVNKYDDDTQALAGSGVEVYHLPKAEREKWMEVLRPYTEEKLAAMGEIGQKIKQVAEEASSKYPYPY